MNVAQPPAGFTDFFEVDGTGFRVGYQAPSSLEQLSIRKPAQLLDAYPPLIEEHHPETIVELGISFGGSTALLALLAKPRKLVAVELKPEPVPALTHFIDQRGLGDRVRPFYGVNQADRGRLTEIVEQEFGGEPIDLVIDDASHLLDETRTSFEVLYPLVRPGGLYLIEDWSAHHLYADARARAANDATIQGQARSRPVLDRLTRVLQADQPGRDQPLSRLVIQLILARASSGDAVADIHIDGHWVSVRRGPCDLDPETFRVTDLYTDHYGLID